jgi:hypothetical protein
VLVNLGGEPERDDSGLPPVDIEVPDDARELDRDVQAYRRELRALRRQQRRMRLHRPLARDGMVLSLLASCLVLALIAGTLLIVFTAGPGGELPGAAPGTPSPSRTASRAPASRAPASRVSAPTGTPTGLADSLTAEPGARLPDKAVEIAGAQQPVRSLAPAVLALVPAGCKCTVAVNQLVSQARTAGVTLYLVGAHGELHAVQQLAAHAPGLAIAAEDTSGALYGAYRPTKLTALLANRDDAVDVAGPLSPGFRLGRQLSALTSAAPSSAPSSAPSAALSSAAAPSAPTPTPTPSSS